MRELEASGTVIETTYLGVLALRKLLPLLLLCFAFQNVYASSSDLPDLSLAASARISSSQEYQIGRAIVRDLQLKGVIVNDPELTAYIQDIGNRIAVHAHEGEQHFSFFVVDDPAINAFALPGGFIGIHTGLLAATSNESELAGVLAHEIAHVSQKHIARMIDDSAQTSMLATAATLAAVLVGSLAGAGSDAIVAAVQTTQASAIQRQINFTRDNEYEADRVGISFMAKSGFDPTGMPEFFRTLSRRNGSSGLQVPEFLRTHPVTSNRIAESMDRARGLPASMVGSSLAYQLSKARVSVLSASSAQAGLKAIEARIEGHPTEERDHLQYAYALALQKAGRAGQALEITEPLFKRHQSTVSFHILLADGLFADGQIEQALKKFGEAQRLFPRNVPLTMRHAAALIEADQPDKARKLMLDLVNNTQYTTEQLRLLAMAASSAGYSGDAHYYMSEFHVLNGQLELAADQLQMAIKSPDIRDYQYARIESRLKEIREVILKSRKRNRNRSRKARPQFG